MIWHALKNILPQKTLDFTLSGTRCDQLRAGGLPSNHECYFDNELRHVCTFIKCIAFVRSGHQFSGYPSLAEDTVYLCVRKWEHLKMRASDWGWAIIKWMQCLRMMSNMFLLLVGPICKHRKLSYLVEHLKMRASDWGWAIIKWMQCLRMVSNMFLLLVGPICKHRKLSVPQRLFHFS